MKTAADRLKHIRDELGLSQEAFGKLAGVTRSAVSLWEDGKTKSFKGDTLLAIQNKTGFSAVWINTGKPPRRVGDTHSGPEVSSVPLISWVQAGQWSEAVDNYRVGEGEKPVYTTRKIGSKAYALRIEGDSMENPSGKPTYPRGAIIIVDPERQAVNGSPVVVRLEDSKEVTFKQLAIEGGVQFLKPLNPRYPILRLNGDATICGVVVQTIIDEDGP